MRPASKGACKRPAAGIQKCERRSVVAGVAPPSTAIAVPWMWRARSEHRNNASAAMSSGLPKRRVLFLTSASGAQLLDRLAQRRRPLLAQLFLPLGVGIAGMNDVHVDVVAVAELRQALGKLAMAALTEPPIRNSGSAVRAAPPMMLTTLPCGGLQQRPEQPA